MSHLLRAIGGDLLPSHYLSERLLQEAPPLAEPYVRQQAVRLARWWARADASCGPLTSVRALFDLAAMPLFAILGFRASGVRFDRAAASVRLDTRAGASVALLVLPWAARRSPAWQSAAAAGRDAGADWCFVLAPPFLSLVDVSGAAAVRRSLDFAFPAALDPGHLPMLLTLARAETFDVRPPHGRSLLSGLVHAAATFQDRVRDDLQHGFSESLGVITAAVRRTRLHHAAPPFEQALALLFRVLFLLFAESRDLVPHEHPIYRESYAVATLCHQAQRPEPARGLWDALAAVTRLSRVGCLVDDLIVRPFNGRLFARAAAPALELRRPARRATSASIERDRALQQTLVALTTREGASGREDIAYADLGVEQLGAVYERVLDLDPDAFGDSPPATRVPARTLPPRSSLRHSDRRKQSGTFYTPQALAEFVVRRTLAPLVTGRTADEILALRVVDPAMGSGAFLVAACRHLAAAYERALVEEGRAHESDFGSAEQADIRRLIAERCLAGVDVHPTAVQLARLSLWLATLSHGKPLNFLDHRLRVGNSLIGAAPEDLRRVPTGRRQRPVQTLPLFEDLDLSRSLDRIARPLFELRERRDDTVQDVRAKEAIWSSVSGADSPLAPWRHAADLWCARWFWPEAPTATTHTGPPSPAETRAAIDAIVKSDATLSGSHLGRWRSIAAGLAATHRFFHWPLEFPDVFYDAAGRPTELPGFDAVVGNPPWEMLREDSGSRDGASSTPRGWSSHHRQLVRFIRDSGLYPSCDRGHVNLYQPFLERSLSLLRPGGRAGLLLPWGLAVDDGAQALRRRLLDEAATDTIVGFDNALGLFPIHRGLRFLAIVATSGRPTTDIRARFGLTTPEEIAALPADATDPAFSSQSVRLSPETLSRVGGPTRRIPDVRHRGQFELLTRLTSEFPALGNASGWGVRFGRELNVTDDRRHFGATGLPILEGKHIQPFAADLAAPRLRIEPAVAARLLGAGRFSHARLAYRDVSGVGNRLSLIAAIVPADVLTSHTLFCLRSPLTMGRQHFLCGLLNSFVLNALVRMLMGGHLTTSLVENLPVPPWSGSRLHRHIAALARRLAARPQDRRAHARLQGMVARLYGLGPPAFDMVLDGFPHLSVEECQLARSAWSQADAAPPRAPRATRRT